MEKYLRVTMPNGSKYDVPALFIAKDRAQYYAEHDTGKIEGKEYNEVYNEEIDIALEDDYEIIDWACNNMNWSDVKGIAIRVEEEEKVDFQEGWCNGEKEVVER